MITREQYMNKVATHRQFFAQFVTPHIKQIVLNHFDVEKLKEALKQDERLNSIPISVWDNLAGSTINERMRGDYIPRLSLNMQLLKDTGEGLSLSTAVCTLKEAAKQIVEENN